MVHRYWPVEIYRFIGQTSTISWFSYTRLTPLAKTPYVTNHVYFKFELKKIALICMGLWEKATKCRPKRKWEFKNKKKRKLENVYAFHNKRREEVTCVSNCSILSKK